MSPAYVLRIFRQFGFSDEEIESLWISKLWKKDDDDNGGNFELV